MGLNHKIAVEETGPFGEQHRGLSAVGFIGEGRCGDDEDTLIGGGEHRKNESQREGKKERNEAHRICYVGNAYSQTSLVWSIRGPLRVPRYFQWVTGKSQSSFLLVAFAIEGRLIHDEIGEILANNIANYQSEKLPIETEEQRSED